MTPSSTISTRNFRRVVGVCEDDVVVVVVAVVVAVVVVVVVVDVVSSLLPAPMALSRVNGAGSRFVKDRCNVLKMEVGLEEEDRSEDVDDDDDDDCPCGVSCKLETKSRNT